MEPSFGRLKKKLGKDNCLSQSLFVTQQQSNSTLPAHEYEDLSSTNNYLLDEALDSRLTIDSRYKSGDRRVTGLTKDVLRACGFLRKKI